MEKSFSFQDQQTKKSKQTKKLTPQKLKSLIQQGGAQIKTGDFSAAIETFTRILEAQPKNSTANYYLGFAFHALGDSKRASKHYIRAVKEKPTLMQGWLNLANTYMLLEQFAEAETAFRKVIDLNPDAPQALHGLGMALGAQDEDTEAIAFFSKAYKLDPESTDVRNNLITALIKSENYNQVLEILEQIPEFQKDLQLLRHYGIALVGIGNLEKAEQALIDYLQQDPKNQEVIYNLARLYQDQTQYEKSLEYFEKLTDKESDIKILSHMGAVLDSLGHFEEAEKVLQKALKLNEQDVTVLNHLGNALTGGNKTKDAENMYRKAIALQGDSAMSHNNLGFALAARGRNEEAMAEYSKAIEIKPSYGESYRNLTTVKKITDKNDPLINQMIEQINDEDITERDKIQFGFALGKALDDCGEYDRAFKYYKIANDLIAQSRPFNVSSFEQHVDNIIEVYSAEFFEKHNNDYGSASDRPIFVVGMSRSGTTLAEKIISSHPLVYGAGELGKLFEVVKNYEKKTDCEYPFAIKNPNAEYLLEAAQDYLKYIGKYMQSDQVNHVVDKMPYNFAHLGFVALALPNAKIIHCKRDPIDTCLSNYFQYFPRGISALYDLDQLSRYYQQYQRLMTHWKRVLPIPFYDLQYEQLIEDQETVTREVISFLDLEWDDACLQSHKSESSVRTASIWQVRQPIYKKSVQRWRNYEKRIGILVDAFAENANS